MWVWRRSKQKITYTLQYWYYTCIQLHDRYIQISNLCICGASPKHNCFHPWYYSINMCNILKLITFILMITGSKAHKELEIILENKLLVKDIGQLSHRDQTSRLESFHKVMIQFASKALHIHYPSMEARFVKSLLQYEQNIQ